MKNLKLVIFVVFCVVISLGIGVAGCKTSTGTAPTGEEATEEAAEEGVTLRILMEDIADTHYVQDLLPEFEKATGIKVEVEIGQYQDMHSKLITQFMAPTSEYDMLEVDNYWAGEFPPPGWLEPLNKYIEKTNFDVSVYIPSMMKVANPTMNESNPNIYCLPFWSYPMGLIYRTDLMENPDLQSAYKEMYNTDLKVPTTLEEFSQIAKFMNDNAGVYGVTMTGARGDPIMMEWSSYLFSLGGDYYDEEWNATVNDDKGIKAVELYKYNIENAAPPGSLSYNFDDTIRIMSQGEAFSLIGFAYDIPIFNDPEQSKISGKVAMIPVPGGGGLAGCWLWGIAANSEHKDEAWEFLNWVESFEIAKERALKGGTPTRSDVFSDPDVIEKYPWYPEMLEATVTNCKAVPEFQYSVDLIETVARELSLICTGEKSAQEGLDLAASEIDELAKKANLK